MVQVLYSAANEAALNAAIAAVDAGSVLTTYTIDVTAGFSLTAGLTAISLAAGKTLIVNGGGFTIDGGGAFQGFQVASGVVAFNALTLADMKALGGAGGSAALGGGGGGGAGLGGGLFVASAGTVTLNGVNFTANSAVGGAGGVGSNSFLGGNGNGGGLNGGGGGGTGYVFSSGTKPGGGGGFGGGGGVGYYGGGGGFGGGGGGGAIRGGGGGFGGGHGGGAGATTKLLFYAFGGGGGLGAGADVFVQSGGVLVIQGGSLGAGSVAGGGNGGGSPYYAATNGSGFGNGLFLQGNQIVTLSPGVGQTLTIAGSIADEHGSVASDSNASALQMSGAGTVLLTGANDFSAGLRLAGGGTVELASAAAAGGGIILFNGTGVLKIDAGTPGNTVFGFAPGETIDFAAIAPGALSVAPIFGSADTAIGGVTVHGVFAAGGATGLIIAPDGGAGTLVSVACFAGGTHIATADGARDVAALRAGDRVRTAFGAVAAVKWVGHRRIDCARHARPGSVMPVRVAAGAFGTGVPRRDVLLSPDHAVYIAGAARGAGRGGQGVAGGCLIPVRLLVNGTSVTQERVAAITYYHVELDHHDVLLAEGLPCESYLDTGNRTAFANGGGAITLHPDFARAAWAARGCAELVLNGPLLDAARRRLNERAGGAGGAAEDIAMRARS